MKKIYVFLLGLLVGAALTILVLFVISKVMGFNNGKLGEDADYLYGAEFFDEPRQTFDFKSVTVFQALDKGYALGVPQGRELLAVLVYKPNEPFYDGQTIKVKGNQKFRQIGIYKYEMRAGGMKTVPIVDISESKK